MAEQAFDDLPRELKRLHAGWRAALRMKLPMPLDRDDLDAVEQSLVRHRLVSIDRPSDRPIDRSVDRPASEPAEAKKQDSQRLVERILACEDLPGRYRSAACVVLQTGRVDLVLEGLSASGQLRRELQQAFRPVFAYLAVILLFTAACSYLMASFVSPELDRARVDLSHHRGTSVEAEGSSAWWLGLIGALSFIGGVGFAAVSFSSAASSAIVDRSITRRYRSERLISVAAEIQRQLAMTKCDVESPWVSRSLVSQLIGVSPNEWANERPSAGRGSGASGSDGPAPASEVRHRGVSEWQLIARHYHVVSQHRLRRLRMTVPFVLCGIFAGAVVAMYTMTLFVPLADLLTEMSGPEVSGIPMQGPMR